MSVILRQELLIYQHFRIIKVWSARYLFFSFSSPKMLLLYNQKTQHPKDGANSNTHSIIEPCFLCNHRKHLKKLAKESLDSTKEPSAIYNYLRGRELDDKRISNSVEWIIDNKNIIDKMLQYRQKRINIAKTKKKLQNDIDVL
ncbi:unnamed protein product [Mucor fragilis]